MGRQGDGDDTVIMAADLVIGAPAEGGFFDLQRQQLATEVVVRATPEPAAPDQIEDRPEQLPAALARERHFPDLEPAATIPATVSSTAIKSTRAPGRGVQVSSPSTTTSEVL